MAAGNSLCKFTPRQNQPPTSTYATPDRRNARDVLDFDAAADEAAVFEDVLPRNYGGNGITAIIAWSATSATSGNVVLGGSFERTDDESLDTDSDSFAAEQTGTFAAPGTSGQVQYSSIAFTNGAQIDSLAVSEVFRFKFRRIGSDGSDTMTGDLELRSIELIETP